MKPRAKKAEACDPDAALCGIEHDDKGKMLEDCGPEFWEKLMARLRRERLTI